MVIRSLAFRYLAPALASFGLAAWVRAQEAKPHLEVCRHADLDGATADRVDLAAVTRRHSEALRLMQKAFKEFTARAPDMKLAPHRGGLAVASARRERTARLAQAVPERIRPLTLWFIRAGRGGAKPRILPESLPKTSEVFVVDAESLEDVARLSKALGRPLSLAQGDFARALGVTSADTRVTFAKDGRTAEILEEVPER